MAEAGTGIDFTWDYTPPKASERPFQSTFPKSRPSHVFSTWQGAKTGFRRGCYIAGPFASTTIIAGLAMTAFGLGSGRGLGVPIFVFVACGFWIGFGLCCGLLGGLIGFLRRLLPASHEQSRLAVLNWEIPFLGKRRGQIDDERNTSSSSRKWLWRGLLASPALAIWLVALSVGVYCGRYADDRLAEALSETMQDDPHWRFNERMAERTKVPDAENGALVVDKVCQMLPVDWFSTPRGSAKEPKTPETDLEKAFKTLEALPSNIMLAESTATTLRQALDRYDKEVRIARTVARYKTGWHDLHVPEIPFETLLPQSQESRHVARLLAMDAAIKIQDGDRETAMEDSRAILGVARSIGDEPFLISLLVRIAVGKVATKSARRALAQGEASDASLAGMQALLLEEKDVAQPNLLSACRAERAGLIELFRRVAAGEATTEAVGSDVETLSIRRSKYPITPWDSLYFTCQQAAAAEWMNRIVAIVQQPVPDRPDSWINWQATFEAAQDIRDWEFHLQAGAYLLIPDVKSADSAQNFYEAELGAMVILLAAERHRMKTGKWPEAIEDIDSSLLPTCPDDPHTGEPYLIDRRDGRFIVYSVGANGEDEDGQLDWPSAHKGELDDMAVELWDLSKRRQPTTEKPIPQSP
jgi:hypothetical protein